MRKAKYKLEEKFRIVKEVSNGEMIGISHFGLLHDIADALGMKNSGCYLRSLNQRISKLMRDFIKAGYPVEEYRIKCCAWSPKETWHAIFEIKELQNG